MIYVTRAIILENDSVLAAQRPEEMSLPLKWELPGGKPEEGEDLETCLHRETWEELRLQIKIVEALPHYDREFRNKLYRIQPYICELRGGEMKLMEHKDAVWQPLDQLFELDWGPAENQVLSRWFKLLPQSKDLSLVVS